MKNPGVGKREKVFGGSMPPPQFWWQPPSYRRLLSPRVRVQPQISSSCDDDGGKMGGVVRSLYLGTLPSLKEVGEAAREKLGRRHL